MKKQGKRIVVLGLAIALLGLTGVFAASKKTTEAPEKTGKGAEANPKTWLLSFKEGDNRSGASRGYHYLQVLVGEKAIYEADIGVEGNLQKELDITDAVGGLKGPKITFRYLLKKGVANYSMEVKISDIKLICNGKVEKTGDWKFNKTHNGFLDGEQINGSLFLTVPVRTSVPGNNYAEFRGIAGKQRTTSRRKSVPEPDVEMRIPWLKWGGPAYGILQKKAEGIVSIKKIINQCKKHNINAVAYFATLTGGQADYQSKIIPRIEPVGWDPLKELIREAHQNDISVYPTICVMTQRAILQKHPDWKKVDKNGQSQGTWACHTNPGFRAWINSVVLEMVNDYKPDGLILDYDRTAPCYCPLCREQYKKAFGVDPVDLAVTDEKWRQWSAERLTELIKGIKETIKKSQKPNIPLAGYTGYSIGAPFQACQDWPTWIEKGYIDALFCTGYQYTPGAFRHNCKKVMEVVKKSAKKGKRKAFPVYFVIGLSTSHGVITDPKQVIRYVEIIREEGGNGVSFFTYPELNPMLADVAKQAFTKKVPCQKESAK